MNAPCARPAPTWCRPPTPPPSPPSLRAAVGRLVPANAPHRAVLLIDGESAGVPGPGPGTPDEASRFVNVETLDGAAAREMEGFATALVCPLVPNGRPTAGSSVGLLVVAAAETVLLTLRGALEVLASQAALAVERVTLSQEVTRRNNEAYFRTLVQNAHDVILIVDDRGLVRYASPSAETLLGPGSTVGRRVRRSRRPGPRRRRAGAPLRVGRGGETGHPQLPDPAHRREARRRRGGLARPPGRSRPSAASCSPCGT